MAVDFFANEAEAWVGANVSASTAGVDTTRVRTGTRFDASGPTSDTPVLPTRTAGCASWRFNNNSGWASGFSAVIWSNAAALQILRVQCTAAGMQQLQYWNGSAWVGVGAALAVAANVTYQAVLVYSGLGTAAGELTLNYTNIATGLVTHTWTASALNLAAATDVARARVTSTNTGTYVISEFVMLSDVANALLSYTRTPAATGADNVGATGTFAAINETGVSDANLVSLAADGDRYSFTGAAQDFTGKKVIALGFTYRARCGATGAQSVRPYLLIGGVRYYAATQILTTSFISGYRAIWDVNPATTLPWLNADAEAASLTFGFEAEV